MAGDVGRGEVNVADLGPAGGETVLGTGDEVRLETLVGWTKGLWARARVPRLAAEVNAAAKTETRVKIMG